MKKTTYGKKRLDINGNLEKNGSVAGRGRRKISALIGLGIIILMLGSGLALWKSSEEDGGDKIEYNGYSFVMTDRGWMTRISGQELLFRYNPKELENISVEGFVPALFREKVYVGFNPAEFSEKASEIQRIRGYLLFSGKNAVVACTKEEGCGDLPVVDCSGKWGDAVMIVVSNDTKIYKDNLCVILNTKMEDIDKIVDLFAYKVLGIMS